METIINFTWNFFIFLFSVLLFSFLVIILYAILYFFTRRYSTIHHPHQDIFGVHGLPPEAQENLKKIGLDFFFAGRSEERKWYWKLFDEPDENNRIRFLGLLPFDHKVILGDHEKVSRLVFRRLLLRYKQLGILTKLTEEQLSGRIEKKNENLEITETKHFRDSNNSDRFDYKQSVEKKIYEPPFGSSGLISYKHAITDLFVEKAITYLEIQAAKYKKWGHFAYTLGLITIVFATVFSGALYLHRSHTSLNDVIERLNIWDESNRKITDQSQITIINKNGTANQDTIQQIVMRVYDSKTGLMYAKIDSLERNIIHYGSETGEWYSVAEKFILGFTFYGFLVLAAVGLWRFGRAMLDQAERLLERRHALRQGRLFVHLHNGELTIDDMEKAFNWNVSQPNAFSHMSTDAKAPWGVVLSEAIKAGAEVAKTTKAAKEKESKKE
ncbi:MAG: hypothetical protein HY960_03000 [Ignavibacteriae bacterium]|nr:hypothetical protein [Ignavibacteriota bacterium]